MRFQEGSVQPGTEKYWAADYKDGYNIHISSEVRIMHHSATLGATYDKGAVKETLI